MKNPVLEVNENWKQGFEQYRCAILSTATYRYHDVPACPMIDI